MIISESNTSSRLQNNHLISKDGDPNRLSELLTFVWSKQLIDPLFSTKDHIACRKIKLHRHIEFNKHNAYSKNSIVISDYSLSLRNKEKKSEQIDLYFGYSYASAVWRLETYKNILENKNIVKNTRERSNMDLDQIELTKYIINDKFIKNDMINS